MALPKVDVYLTDPGPDTYIKVNDNKIDGVSNISVESPCDGAAKVRIEINAGTVNYIDVRHPS